MKKDFLDNFNDIRIWVLQNKDGKIIGKILWKFSQDFKTCKCGMQLYAFDINFATIGTASGYGYEHVSAAYADLMRRLEIECQGVDNVDVSAVYRHLKERFNVDVFDLV